MGTSAKRHFRALVAPAIFGAVLGLGSGPASALVIDFDPDPTGGGTPTTFDSDGFRFEFTGDGDGGVFDHMTIGGDPNNVPTINALSTLPEDGSMTIESITIVLAADSTATFFFDSIYIDSIGGPNTTVEGRLGGVGGTIEFTSTFAASQQNPVDAGGVAVDTVRLLSTNFEGLRFDTFTVNSQIPEPGTLALFVTGLIGLGLLSRRRRQS